MNVNFNNLRKQALFTYDRLAKELNRNIYKRDEYIPNANDRLICINKHVVVDIEDIQEMMDDLRMYLFSIACVYEEGSENFKDVSEEVQPIEFFNDEEANNEQKK